jgi:uncharacterized protein
MSDLRAPETIDCHEPLHPKAIVGMDLFNTGHFFDAHEAFETAWREESGPVRDLYRGILQVAVVYLHILNQNYPGAVKVYQRSQKWLTLWPETCRGIAIGQLRSDLEAVITELQKLGPQRMAEFDLCLLKPINYFKSEI